jgi:hypothetical protein
MSSTQRLYRRNGFIVFCRVANLGRVTFTSRFEEITFIARNIRDISDKRSLTISHIAFDSKKMISETPRFRRFFWHKSSGEFFRSSDKELDRLTSTKNFINCVNYYRAHYSYFRLSPLKNFIKNLDAFHWRTEMSRRREAAPSGFQSRYNRSWCCSLKTPTEKAHPQSHKQKHDSPLPPI